MGTALLEQARLNSLIGQAWGAFGNDDVNAIIYSEKLIEIYLSYALSDQASLSDIPVGNNGFNYPNLNNVGTAYFIKAHALRNLGHNELALKACKAVINNLYYSQSWDPSGWFWPITAGCSDVLSTLSGGTDFSNTASYQLVGNAWGALSGGDDLAAIIYAIKALEVHQKTARDQGQGLTGFPTTQDAPNYWALNDIGTACYIAGEAYRNLGRPEDALSMYRICVNVFSFAQAWDPAGWYWPPASPSQQRIDAILDQ